MIMHDFNSQILKNCIGKNGVKIDSSNKKNESDSTGSF
jgi:hypothetical protein